MMSEIASAHLACVAPDGREFDAKVSIGTPYLAALGEWRCPVSPDSLEGRIPDMAGEDALQALCMALSTARALLEHFVERGGRLSHHGSSSHFDLRVAFGRVGATL